MKMVSDIVCEYLVKRKIDVKQILQAAVIVTLGFIVTDVIAFFLSYADRTRLLFTLLFLCGMGLTVFLTRFALIVEYEYSFVNGELTVDRILARSQRKHMLDVNVKTIYKLGYVGSGEINEHNIDSVKDYSSSRNDKETVFACYKDENSGKNILLFFTPNQKIIDSMKPYVNATVYREAFSKNVSK